MKKLIKNLPEPIRYWLTLIVFTAELVAIYTWPLETIGFLIVGSTIYREMAKDWNATIAFFMVCVISSAAGLSVWGISKLAGAPEYVQVLLYFIASIYALALVTDEQHQKPYIWLWRQCKKLFQKRQHKMLMS